MCITIKKLSFYTKLCQGLAHALCIPKQSLDKGAKSLRRKNVFKNINLFFEHLQPGTATENIIGLARSLNIQCTFQCSCIPMVPPRCSESIKSFRRKNECKNIFSTNTFNRAPQRVRTTYREREKNCHFLNFEPKLISCRISLTFPDTKQNYFC